MTKVTEVLARAARQCSIDAPSSWVSSTDTEIVELRDDFMIEAIEDIRDRVELPAPVAKTATITGTGDTNYSLESDFVRLQSDALSVYDTLLDRPCIPVGTDGQWEHQNDIGTAGVIRYFRTKGYEGNFTIDFFNALSTGDTVKVSYISDVWMKSSGGVEGKSFTDADDVILYPRRIIEAGIVWRFRQRKGLPYEDKRIEYEAMIARLANQGKNRRVVNMGDRETVHWQDLVPAFIPSS